MDKIGKHLQIKPTRLRTENPVWKPDAFSFERRLFLFLNLFLFAPLFSSGTVNVNIIEARTLSVEAS